MIQKLHAEKLEKDREIEMLRKSLDEMAKQPKSRSRPHSAGAQRARKNKENPWDFGEVKRDRNSPQMHSEEEKEVKECDFFHVFTLVEAIFFFIYSILKKKKRFQLLLNLSIACFSSSFLLLK